MFDSLHGERSVKKVDVLLLRITSVRFSCSIRHIFFKKTTFLPLKQMFHRSPSSGVNEFPLSAPV